MKSCSMYAVVDMPHCTDFRRQKYSHRQNLGPSEVLKLFTAQWECQENTISIESVRFYLTLLSVFQRVAEYVQLFNAVKFSILFCYLV